MGLDIWFREDIERMLNGLDKANAAAVAQADSVRARIYRQGFVAALEATKVSFGIKLPQRVMLVMNLPAELQGPQL